MSVDTTQLTAVEYERGLLSAALNDGATFAAAERAGLTPECFQTGRHGALYVALGRAHAEGAPWQMQTLGEWLVKAGSVKAESLLELFNLYELGRNSANAAWYVGKLLDLTHRRNLLEQATRVHQLAEQGAEPDRIMAAARGLMVANPKAELGMTSLGELAELGLAEIELRATGVEGLRFGFPHLDSLLPGGVRNGNVITVVGPTGGGKSTLALDFARNFAIRQGLITGVFSLEMSGQEIFDKVLAAEADIPHSTIMRGQLTDSQWSKAAHVAGKVATAPLYTTSAGHNLEQIEMRARLLAGLHGRIDVIIVDHVGLVVGNGRTRAEELSGIMRGLKRLSVNLNCVVIALAQMNRAGTDADRPPELRDIKDSSEIEQSSSLVVMLHDPTKDNSARAGERDLWVRKNRFGRNDVPVPLAAQLHLSRFLPMPSHP